MAPRSRKKPKRPGARAAQPAEATAAVPKAAQWRLPWNAPVKAAVLTGLIFAVYFPALKAPFYFDDFEAIVNNPRVHGLEGLPEILGMYFVGRGLVQVTLLADWLAYGGKPWGFHLTNILMHAAAAGLVWLTVNQLVRLFHRDRGPGAPDLGYWAAAFFAVHPVQTETVTYVISRSGMLAAMVYLATVCAVAALLRRECGPAAGVRQRLARDWPIAVAVLAGLGIGIGGKETIVTLPAMVLMILFLSPAGRPVWMFALRALNILAPLVALFFVYAWVRARRLGGFLAFDDTAIRTPWENALTQAKIVAGYYPSKIALPLGLNIDPDIAMVQSAADPAFLASAAAILAAFAAAWAFRRTRPMVSLGILWYFIALVPTSSFIPLFDLAAERRVYLPMVGVSMLAAGIITALPRIRVAAVRDLAVAGAAAYALLLAGLTLQRNSDYTDPLRLWRQSALHSPAKMRPFCNYIHALMREGREDEAIAAFANENAPVTIHGRNIDELASLEFLVGFMIPRGLYVDYIAGVAERFAETYPDSIDANEILQSVYLLTKQYGKLEETVQRGLKIDSSSAATWQNQALIHRLRNELEPAEECLERCLELDPDYAPAIEELIALRRAAGKDTEALEARLRSIRERKAAAGYDEMFYFNPGRE